MGAASATRAGVAVLCALLVSGSHAVGGDVVVAGSGSHPRPPVVTKAQQAAHATSSRKAAAASAAATPELLALLASSAFRKLLSRCCPDAAKLDAGSLLDALRAEARVAEIAHCLPASRSDKPGGLPGVDLPDLEKFGWVLNPWQASIVHADLKEDDPRCELGGDAADGASARVNIGPTIAETAIFGCPDFANPRRPTWDEAADRLIYAAHNLRRIDSGSFNAFGDLGVVFRTSAVASMVEIASADTGVWEASCNDTIGPPKLNLNCSVPITPVGTLDHFDHVMLFNLRQWAAAPVSPWRPWRKSPLPIRTPAEMAAALVARSALGPAYPMAPNVTFDVAEYWEANVVGNPRLSAIKFVLPLFGALFGTAVGTEMKAFAARQSWPVLWTFGYPHMPNQTGTSTGTGTGNTNCSGGAAASIQGATHPLHQFPTPYPANARLLDPTINSSTLLLNASIPPGAVQSFDAVWTEVAEARSQGPISEEQLRAYWAKLESVRLAPVSAIGCADADGCVGIDVASADCVCTR